MRSLEQGPQAITATRHSAWGRFSGRSTSCRTIRSRATCVQWQAGGGRGARDLILVIRFIVTLMLFILPSLSGARLDGWLAGWLLTLAARHLGFCSLVPLFHPLSHTHSHISVPSYSLILVLSPLFHSLFWPFSLTLFFLTLQSIASSHSHFI